MPKTTEDVSDLARTAALVKAVEGAKAALGATAIAQLPVAIVAHYAAHATPPEVQRALVEAVRRTDTDTFLALCQAVAR